MFKSNDCLILCRDKNYTMEYTDKQKLIIDVAERLFADNGFAGTSVRDIAKEADVNIAMISYYFGSKEKLLEAIFERHGEIIRMKLESIINNKDLTPFQKIETLIEHYLEKYFCQKDFHKIVAREQMSLKETPISNMLHEMKKNNQLLVKQIISEGQKKGDFKKHIDIPLMMATIIGTSNQVMTTQHFYREINNLQHMNEEDFLKHLRKKLGQHLKSLFKAILTYED